MGIVNNDALLRQWKKEKQLIADPSNTGVSTCRWVSNRIKGLFHWFNVLDTGQYVNWTKIVWESIRKCTNVQCVWLPDTSMIHWNFFYFFVSFGPLLKTAQAFSVFDWRLYRGGPTCIFNLNYYILLRHVISSTKIKPGVRSRQPSKLKIPVSHKITNLTSLFSCQNTGDMTTVYFLQLQMQCVLRWLYTCENFI